MKKTILFFLLFLSFWASSQSQENFQHLEKKVNQYIQWMLGEPSPDLWEAALRLEKLGPDCVPLIQKRMRELPEHARVACAKALISLGSREYGMQVLLTILQEGSQTRAKVDAAGVIAIQGDYELEDTLVQVLEKTYDPYVKIAISKALWQVSHHEKAKKSLKEFLTLDSSNADLQFTAAIALAEIGDILTAKPVLSQIKDEPSLRGRLAKSFLDKETTINHYERLLMGQSSKKSPAENEKSKYALIDEVLNKIHTYHITGNKFTDEELINAAVRGMVARTDVHSAFWTKAEWDDFFKSTVSEEYVGIGVYVTIQNGYFTVIAPIYSGPAYKAGIRSLDRIVAVDEWSTVDKSVDEIVNRIRGTEGTSVKIKVHRKGWDKVREMTIVREKIKIPNLFAQLLPEGIGYIRLLQFGRKATSDMEAALEEMQGRGMKAFILDLRENAGGWLQTAVEVVEKFLDARHLFNLENSALKFIAAGKPSQELIALFEKNGQKLSADAKIEVGNSGKWEITFPEGKNGYSIVQEDGIVKVYEADKLIVYSKGRDPVKGREYRYFTTSRGTLANYPMVVLIDNSSASASEIVAGALQCHRRASIVGMRSFGKGSVQEPMPLDTVDGARLKLTIAMYYLPDGRCIHNEMDSYGNIVKHNGIKPDIEVEYETHYESWKVEERAKLEEKEVFKEYLQKHYSSNQALFHKLADSDNLSFQEYPVFEEWYRSLNTRASLQDVRAWLRTKIRQQTADDRGVPYACDYLEDNMLQRAISELCKSMNVSLENVNEYKIFAKKIDLQKK